MSHIVQIQRVRSAHSTRSGVKRVPFGLVIVLVPIAAPD
jgi:hypothetical protein